MKLLLGDGLLWTSLSVEYHGKKLALNKVLLDTGSAGFWTGVVGKSKLWSPGRWSEKSLKESGLEALIPVKWAFNAKPDLMILSGEQALLIEAKLESGEGRDEQSGYEQLSSQMLWILHRQQWRGRHGGKWG